MPSIYVASLADYTCGRLHGVWIDLDLHRDVDDVQDIVQQMLDESPALLSGEAEVAEEYAIHDSDGFDGYDVPEYLPLSDAVAISSAIDEHGAGLACFLNRGNRSDTVAGAIDDFHDRHIGTWTNADDYAWEQFESLHPDSYNLVETFDWISFEPETWVRAEECDGYEFIDTSNGVTVLAPER